MSQNLGYEVVDRIFAVGGCKRFKLIRSSEIMDYTTLLFVIEIEYTETTKHLLQIDIYQNNIVNETTISEQDVAAFLNF